MIPATRPGVTVTEDQLTAQQKVLLQFHRELMATRDRYAALSLRAFWINNADKPWRARAFHPDVIERAHAFGYMNWANQVQDHVRGQSVLDVGCGPGLHGLGYLAAGANSYLCKPIGGSVLLDTIDSPPGVLPVVDSTVLSH